MNEMNFIPANMALQQRNQRLIRKSSKAIAVSIFALLLTLISLTAYNQFLKKEVVVLSNKKNQINELLKERDSEKNSLKKSQLVAASLDNLNSFTALTALLKMLNNSIPDETLLINFETEFDKNGQSIATINGVSDTHQNLTQWVSDLQRTDGVQSATLISSESIQSASTDELKQKFLLKITRLAHKESRP